MFKSLKQKLSDVASALRQTATNFSRNRQAEEQRKKEPTLVVTDEKIDSQSQRSLNQQADFKQIIVKKDENSESEGSIPFQATPRKRVLEGTSEIPFAVYDNAILDHGKLLHPHGSNYPSQIPIKVPSKRRKISSFTSLQPSHAIIPKFSYLLRRESQNSYRRAKRRKRQLSAIEQIRKFQENNRKCLHTQRMMQEGMPLVDYSSRVRSFIVGQRTNSIKMRGGHGHEHFPLEKAQGRTATNCSDTLESVRIGYQSLKSKAAKFQEKQRQTFAFSSSNKKQFDRNNGNTRRFLYKQEVIDLSNDIGEHQQCNSSETYAIKLPAVPNQSNKSSIDSQYTPASTFTNNRYIYKARMSDVKPLETCEAKQTYSYMKGQVSRRNNSNEINQLNPILKRPLTQDEERILSYVLDETKDPNEVICKRFNAEFRRKDLMCLREGEWLNDEVINYLMEKLNQELRELARSERKGPSIFLWSTHFYAKLMENDLYNFSNVRRWTDRKKLDMISMSKIIVPIHVGIHWALAVINVRKRQIEYYDSLGQKNEACCINLLNWLVDEIREKTGRVVSTSEWRFVFVRDVPKQNNSSDCGIFLCQFARRCVYDLDFNFSDKDIPYFRLQLILEVIRGRNEGIEK